MSFSLVSVNFVSKCDESIKYLLRKEKHRLASIKYLKKKKKEEKMHKCVLFRVAILWEEMGTMRPDGLSPVISRRLIYSFTGFCLSSRGNVI